MTLTLEDAQNVGTLSPIGTDGPTFQPWTPGLKLVGLVLAVTLNEQHATADLLVAGEVDVGYLQSKNKPELIRELAALGITPVKGLE